MFYLSYQILCCIIRLYHYCFRFWSYLLPFSIIWMKFEFLYHICYIWLYINALIYKLDDMSNLIDHDHIHITVFFYFFIFCFVCLMNPALCYFINSSVIGYTINLKLLEWCCYIIALIPLHILMTFVVWFDFFIYIFVRADFKFCNGGEFCL